jgi:hypothetical protein
MDRSDLPFAAGNSPIGASEGLRIGCVGQGSECYLSNATLKFPCREPGADPSRLDLLGVCMVTND